MKTSQEPSLLLCMAFCKLYVSFAADSQPKAGNFFTPAVICRLYRQLKGII